jgi:hypothetical protein
MCGYPTPLKISVFTVLRPKHSLGSETQFIIIGALVQRRAFHVGYVMEKVASGQTLYVCFFYSRCSGPCRRLFRV